MRQVPASVTVIAVLHFAFGGLGLLGDVCAGGMFFAGGGSMFTGFGGNQSPHQKQLQDEMQRAMEGGPAYKIVQFGEIAWDLAISFTMITSGIGLLKLRPWGRNLSVIYALLSIALKIFSIVYVLAFTQPALNEFLRLHQASNQEEQMVFQFMKIFSMFPPIIGLLLMIYPIVVLVIMFRPAIAAAFRGEGREARWERRSDRDEREEPEEINDK
ncbi:MAG TPA: hypothetical protein VGX70_15240 [Gemmataceae bacterium]|jgi:hypothetical protein|nr:hypothetical protein [Gemmataceae bacterium]